MRHQKPSLPESANQCANNFSHWHQTKLKQLSLLHITPNFLVLITRPRIIEARRKRQELFSSGVIDIIHLDTSENNSRALPSRHKRTELILLSINDESSVRRSRHAIRLQLYREQRGTVYFSRRILRPSSPRREEDRRYSLAQKSR